MIMKLCKYILLAASLLAFNLGATAQSRNSYFMEGSYFRNELNPALAPSQGYVAVPLISGLGMNLNSNFLAVDNFFFERNGKVVTALHESVSADDFLGKLPNKNKLAANFNFNLFGGGFYHKNTFWNFGANLRSVSDMNISKDIFTALKTLGNGTYDLSNTSLSTKEYAEIYVGHSRNILDWVTVGAKVKFLVGIGNALVDIDQMQATIGREQVAAHMRGLIRANGVFINSSGAKAGDEISDEVFTSGLIFGSYGAAVDLGAEVRLLDNRLRVSGAITDLGFIGWSSKSRLEANIKGDFEYNGINFDTGEADIKSESGLYVEGNTGKGYATRLNCALNFGAEYNILDDRIGFGLLSHTEFCQTMSFTELTASANFRPLNWLSATLSHTLCNRNRFGVMGFALNLHATGVNFFVGADYMGLGMVKYADTSIPRNMKSTNFYMGLGFGLGNKKK